MYKDYDIETLKHLQKLEKMILKDFIDICNENDLKYFLHGGTLLGAIRHHDFIPWDDDIDVIMFREDYDKFVKIFESKQQNKYTLITSENTLDYFLLFSKISLNGTKFKEWWDPQVNFDLGIFLDIFIIDNLPKNKIMQKFHILKSRIYSRLIAISTLKFKNYPLITQIIVNSIHNLLKFLNITPQFFKRKINKINKKYEKTDSNDIFWVTSIKYPTIYSKNDFIPVKMAKFGDLDVSIPNNYKKLLTDFYGDYMKIPPKSKRYNHVTYDLDFGKYDI